MEHVPASEKGPVHRKSPFVCLSTQCAALDAVGGSGFPPHAYSALHAGTVCTRGREGIGFTSPRLPLTAPRTEKQLSDKCAAPSEPCLVVREPDVSGYELFYQASPKAEGTVVCGSAAALVQRTCTEQFDSLEMPPGASADVTKQLFAEETTVKPLQESLKESNPSQAPRSPTVEHLAYPTPAPLLCRALTQVLLILRLPGRSPAATFTLRRPTDREQGSSSQGDSALAHQRCSTLNAAVRFCVEPTAALQFAEATTGATGCASSFDYEIGAFHVQGTLSGRKRPHVGATEKAAAAGALIRTVAPSHSLRCRIIGPSAREGCDPHQSSLLGAAEVDCAALLSRWKGNATASEVVGDGDRLASGVLLQHPQLVTEGLAQLPLVECHDTDDSEVPNASSFRLERFLNVRVVRRLLRYMQTTQGGTAPQTQTSEETRDDEAGVKQASSADGVQGQGDGISAPALVSFLQRRSFALLAALTHLSWCRYIAEQACAALNAKDGESNGQPPRTRAFLLMDGLASQGNGRSLTFTEPSEKGFTSLLVIAPLEVGHESVPARPRIITQALARGGGCLVLVTGARDVLTWKSLRINPADAPLTPPTGTGTLRDLIVSLSTSSC